MILRILLSAALLFPTAAWAGEASETVGFFYRSIGAETLPENRDRFTGKARAFLDANDRAWDEKEEVCLGFGLSVDAQDYDEAEIARSLKMREEPAGEGVLVTADFMLFGATRSIEWTVVRESGVWKVADIASPDGGWRMSELQCE